ncbi:MAG: UDP-glucose 4-epimerase GalE [Bacilli bacterium]|nr:UDP-glucose 4-epimerase GalE [Bacilli bacterium]
MKILVTGGLGFIGSHTVVELLDEDYEVVIIDDLSNSSIDVVDKIREITGKEVKFYEADVCDLDALEKIFLEQKIDAVMHFAGYKAVGESVKEPIMYYENNLVSTLHLCKKMLEHDCNKFIFSSSATVYGDPEVLPITEECKVGGTTNPYGTTKLMIERILADIHVANPQFTAIILRYFNPIGAHKSGLIGEKPNGIPNNLMPYIVRVASGELKILSVFGDDYDTPDGTGVRDYIHVVDLAKGHLSALKKAINDEGLFYYNLGTGKGYSVLDLVKNFEKVNNVKVPYKIVDRRPGDIASCYADPSKALKELGWKAELGIEDMMRDSYNFILKQNKKK